MRSSWKWKRCVVCWVDTVIRSECQIVAFANAYPSFRLGGVSALLKTDDVSLLIANNLASTCVRKACAFVFTIDGQRTIHSTKMLMVICPMDCPSKWTWACDHSFTEFIVTLSTPQLFMWTEVGESAARDTIDY